MMNEESQQIHDILIDDQQLSITLQATDKATRVSYNIQECISIKDLSFLAATMIQGQKMLMMLFHKHCIELGISTEEFNKEVIRNVGVLDNQFDQNHTKQVKPEARPRKPLEE